MKKQIHRWITLYCIYLIFNFNTDSKWHNQELILGVCVSKAHAHLFLEIVVFLGAFWQKGENVVACFIIPSFQLNYLNTNSGITPNSCTKLISNPPLKRVRQPKVLSTIISQGRWEDQKNWGPIKEVFILISLNISMLLLNHMANCSQCIKWNILKLDRLPFSASW